MMKIFFTFLFVNLFISVNAQCKLITETDQYTGIELKSTRYEEVGKFRNFGLIRFKLTRTTDKDSLFRLYIQISQKKTKCISTDSKILIATDSATIGLKLFSQNNSEEQYDNTGMVSGLIFCGKDLECFADLTPDEINILKKNKMNRVSVYYPGEYYEFQVINDYRNQYEYFIRTLKCFE